MSSFEVERTVRSAAMVLAVLAGAGAVVVDGYLEITLLMVAAVIAALICFDTAMERRLRSFAPWALLSLAPIVKTVPTVWAELRSDTDAIIERYDHLGSLLLGAVVFAAVAILAQPAEQVGSSRRLFVSAVIAGSALTGGLAGASVAFLYDSGFGSSATARLLETPTWFVLSGLLAAAVIAASQTRRMSFGLTGVLGTACATAGLLAVSVAGRDLDPGWWALVFAGLVVSAAGTSGSLGHQQRRDRQSNVVVIVALVAGLVGAASAIAARSDRTAWSPGWALLGIVALVMFALAMVIKPVVQPTDKAQIGTAEDDERSPDRELGIQPPAAQASGDTVLAPEQSVDDFASQLQPQRPWRTTGRASLAQPPAEPVTTQSELQPPDDLDPPQEHVPAAATERDAVEGVAQRHPPQPVPPEPPVVPSQAVPPLEATADPAPTPAPTPDSAPVAVAESPDPAPVVARAHIAEPSDPSREAVVPQGEASPQSALSDAGAISSARAAAEIRTAPPSQRHSLAPLAQAHHFDPSTGLLSSAGLQHAIARAFDVQRRAGHVTMLMFMIRDLDRIEQDHGRLASAAVTREVADRIGLFLPQGTGARFARSAYAVVFVGDLSNVTETTQWLARVLLQLRAPVEGGSLGDKIDVVAGMAQCYESEEAAQFVERANRGLARAVQLPEPTLVAMP